MNDSVESSIILLTFFTFLIVIVYYLINRQRQIIVRHGSYIQGVWERKGNTEMGEAWFIRYNITANTITAFADPPMLFQASYNIKNETENLVTLELGQLETDPPYPEGTIAEMPIAIDRKRQQILIGDKIFKRV